MRISILVGLSIGVAALSSSAALGQGGATVAGPGTDMQYEPPPDPSCRLIRGQNPRWRCPASVVRRMQQPAQGSDAAAGSAPGAAPGVAGVVAAPLQAGAGLVAGAVAAPFAVGRAITDPLTTGSVGPAAAGAVPDPVTGQLYEAPPDPRCRMLMTEPRQWQCPPGAVGGMAR